MRTKHPLNVDHASNHISSPLEPVADPETDQEGG